MSVLTSQFYGAVPVAQPTGQPGPQPSPENTTPIRTTAVPGRQAVLHRPAFWIVVIIALAVGLAHLSIRFSA